MCSSLLNWVVDRSTEQPAFSISVRPLENGTLYIGLYRALCRVALVTVCPSNKLFAHQRTISIMCTGAQGGWGVLISCMSVAVWPYTPASIQCRNGTRWVFTYEAKLACAGGGLCRFPPPSLTECYICACHRQPSQRSINRGPLASR